MDDIQIVCSGYKLLHRTDDRANSEKIGYSGGSNTIIMHNDIEVKVHAKHKNDFEWELTINDKTMTINKAFMAEKSKEYVTVTEMWFRYKDNMENFRDTYDCCSVFTYDDNIFILAYDTDLSTMMGISFLGFFPFTLYKYDIDRDEVQYAGYYVNKSDMYTPIRILKIE